MGEQYNKHGLVFLGVRIVRCSYIESIMPLVLFSPLRLWKKLVLSVSSCLHWTHRSCHLPPHLPDGGPGAAADVSDVVAVPGCCWIAHRHTWVLPVAFLGVSHLQQAVFVSAAGHVFLKEHTQPLSAVSDP